MTINTDVLIRHFSFVIPTEIERHHHSSVSASILFTYHRCSRFPFCIFDFDAMIYGSPISSKHLFSMFFRVYARFSLMHCCSFSLCLELLTFGIKAQILSLQTRLAPQKACHLRCLDIRLRVLLFHPAAVYKKPNGSHHISFQAKKVGISGSICSSIFPRAYIFCLIKTIQHIKRMDQIISIYFIFGKNLFFFPCVYYAWIYLVVSNH